MTLELKKLFLDSIYDESDFSAEQINELELGIATNKTQSYMNPMLSVEEMQKARQPKNIKLNI